MKVIHHKPTRVWGPSTLGILAAIVLVPALSALVLPDTARLEGLRREHTRLKERETTVRSQHNLGQHDFEPDLADKTALAEAELEAFFPREVSELDVVELVRSVAELNQLQLTELAVGEVEPTENATESHPLGARTTSLRGRASLEQLRSLLHDLRELGAPLSLSTFELTRDGDEATGAFVFSMRVKLYQRMAELPAQLETWSQP